MHSSKRLELQNTTYGSSRLIEWLVHVFEIAIRQQVSDVHFEPFDALLLIRFRMGGFLKEVLRIEKPYSNNLVRCVKILANLDITLHRNPQEGRFTLRIDNIDTNFRVAIVPTLHGESMVIRILDNRLLSSTISSYLQDEEINRLFKLIQQSQNGLTLICGPTGSGKTSFLYALLNYLSRADLKIITVEDPVEYVVNGITQIQLDSKRNVDFSEVLKRVLRHDPDIIMVGEIRDVTTAKVAIQAALTGHLVLTTLHASDTVMAIGRLINLGIEPYLLAATCRCIIAQRLFPYLCSFCIGEKKEKLGDDTPCNNCNGLSYKGRQAVREMLYIDEVIAEMIHENISLEQLRAVLKDRGMVTLKMQMDKLLQVNIIDATIYKMLGIE